MEREWGGSGKDQGGAPNRLKLANENVCRGNQNKA